MSFWPVLAGTVRQVARWPARRMFRSPTPPASQVCRRSYAVSPLTFWRGPEFTRSGTNGNHRHAPRKRGG